MPNNVTTFGFDPDSRSKTALVLAGGGLTGAVYELGALRAINDLLVDFTVNDFDIYVGTSAGSIVASGLANGITPQEMLQSMDGSHPFLRQIQRRDLFTLNIADLRSSGINLPRAMWDAIKHYAAHPNDFNLLDLGWFLLDELPSSIYDVFSLEKYIRDIILSAGSTEHFNKLSKELYIIATELDTGDRAVFGNGYRLTSIPRAVSASSAVPILYKPVRIGNRDFIDGGLRGNASLDVAIEQGAELVVCVNPMKPVDHTQRYAVGDTTPISKQGMQAMINQIMRINMHAGLHYHVKQLRRRHPNVDIILIEPQADEDDLLDSNVMRLSARVQIAQYGYESVTVDLASEYDTYKNVLARNQIEISRSRVIPQLELMEQAGGDAEVMRDILESVPIEAWQRGPRALEHALEELDALLDEMNGVTLID
jgi:predicted acylesterase/phospholipase RssA